MLQSLNNLRNLVEEGKILPYITDTMSLWDVDKAWRSFSDGSLKGKTVFTL